MISLGMFRLLLIHLDDDQPKSELVGLGFAHVVTGERAWSSELGMGLGSESRFAGPQVHTTEPVRTEDS